jgi:hypothetical protein
VEPIVFNIFRNDAQPCTDYAIGSHAKSIHRGKIISRFLGGNMFRGISFESDSESIEKFRETVRKMPDEELIRQGKMLRDLCNDRKPPEVWVQKKVLRVREEYRRRHPKIL